MKIKQEKLLKEISTYLINKENDGEGDPTVIRLFQGVVEIFTTKITPPQTLAAAEAIRAPITSLEATLSAIDKRLTRMEQQGTKMAEPRKTQSYVQAAAASYQRAVPPQGAPTKKTSKEKSPKEALLESRKAKNGDSDHRPQGKGGVDEETHQGSYRQPTRKMRGGDWDKSPRQWGYQSVHQVCGGQEQSTDAEWVTIIASSAALRKRTYGTLPVCL